MTVATALGHTTHAIAGLAEAVTTNPDPEVAKIFRDLVKATHRFAESMAACTEGSEFLQSTQRCHKYAVRFAGDDDTLLGYFYNCIRCTQKSLKAFVYKRISEDYLDEMRRYPIEVYEQFFKGVKDAIATDCKNPQAVEAIHRYADVVLLQIRGNSEHQG